MSLPDDEVFALLQNDFVVGWNNIWRQPFVGSSGGYSRKNSAVGTTNGAGGRNVQLFVLAPDLTVLHALAGFWHPEDLARELRFAKVVFRLWEDESRSLEDKRTMLRHLHLAEVHRQPEDTYARSSWQSFDAATERRLAENQDRDTVIKDEQGAVERMKPLNVLVHERALAQAFVPFGEFDIAAFVDYGNSFYDLNRRHESPFKMPSRKGR